MKLKLILSLILCVLGCANNLEAMLVLNEKKNLCLKQTHVLPCTKNKFVISRELITKESLTVVTLGYMAQVFEKLGIYKSLLSPEMKVVRKLLQDSDGDANLALTEALRSKLPNSIKHILIMKFGADINAKFDFGRFDEEKTRLVKAVEDAELVMVEELLAMPLITIEDVDDVEFAEDDIARFKLDPNVLCSHFVSHQYYKDGGYTLKSAALHFAINKVYRHLNHGIYNELTLKIFDLLINHANIDLDKEDDYHHRTPLNYAIDFEAFSLMTKLLDAGAKAVNYPWLGGYKKCTVAHLLVGSGTLWLVNKLVDEKRCDINALDEYGRSPLFCAIETYGLGVDIGWEDDCIKLDVLKKKLDFLNTKGAKFNHRDQEGKTVLDHVQSMLNRCRNDRHTQRLEKTIEILRGYECVSSSELGG